MSAQVPEVPSPCAQAQIGAFEITGFPNVLPLVLCWVDIDSEGPASLPETYLEAVGPGHADLLLVWIQSFWPTSVVHPRNWYRV